MSLLALVKPGDNQISLSVVLLKQNHKMALVLLIQHEKEISIVFTFYPCSNTQKKIQGEWFEIYVLFTYS